MGASVALVQCELPVRTVSESNRRDHWAAKARRTRDQRTTVHLRLVGQLRGALERHSGLTVELSRLTARALDDDNLRGALKAVRDGVADALGIDDRDPRVTWAYAQRKRAGGGYGIGIVVRAVELDLTGSTERE
jgi:hypothetical protein